MEEIIKYLIKVNLAVFILYSLYWLLIRNDRKFQINRIYLLSTLLFAFVFPFISFPESVETFANTNQFHFSEGVLGFSGLNDAQIMTKSTIISGYNFQIFLFYFLIGAFLLLRMIFELIRIVKKIVAYDKIKKDRFTLVVNKGFKSPFSFLHYIFVEKYPGMENMVIEHEKVHARQLHTLDLFIAQISSALLWINPFMYLLKKELVAQHEFLADNHVLNAGENYEKYLKQVVIQLQSNFNSSLVSKFNYSLTKKRLKMMKNIKSNQKNVFKYFVLFITTGIIAGLFAFTNTETKSVGEGNLIAVPSLIKSADNEPAIWPINKEKITIGSEYGMRMHPIYKKKKKHLGIDLKAERGTEIIATENGVVRVADYKGNYGKRIIIDHDKVYSTLYAHLSKYKVKSGDKVKKGDVIGYVGETGMSTAPHLHYEVMKAGKNVNPANYMK